MNQNSSPLVSIIVITYNSAKFVFETLESAKNQSYQNIELIISDDCSTDNTIEICGEWIKQNKNRFVNIELITVKKNTGIPANCNRGVNASKGEWIKIIAGDDVFFSECISLNVNYIIKNNNIRVLFSYMDQYLEKFLDECYYRTLPKNQIIDTFYNKEIKEQYGLMLLNDRISNTPTSFIKKSALYEVGNFDEEFKLVEDYPIWLKLLNAGNRFYFLEETTVKHRIHSDNVFGAKKEYLIHPTYLDRKKMREKYIYPNLKYIYKLSMNYQDLVAFFVLKILKNKKNTITVFLYETMFIRINIFYRLIQIFKISIR